MSTLVFALVEFVAALVLSYIGVSGLRLFGERFGILDIPNERSSHSRSVPRGGGLMIVILTLIGVWMANYWHQVVGRSSLVAYTTGALLIVAISWLDDFKSQPSWLRFGVHGSAAIIAIFGYGYLQIGSFVSASSLIAGTVGVVLTFLWIVGLTNAYNFMDGIDGIAGGQALVASLGWALAGWIQGNPLIVIFGALLGASTLGFLFHNWPPARIFMGDVGSAFLGYTFAVLPLIFAVDAPLGTRKISPLFAGVTLLWPFVFDSTFTLLRRLRSGENIFKAHRSHLYQRLVLAGYSHKSVSLLYSALAIVGMIFVLGWALGFRNVSTLVAVVLPLLCLALWAFVIRSEQKQARASSSQVPRFADPT